MDVNVNGAFYEAAAKILKQQGLGNVVFTASVSASLVDTPQRQAFAATSIGKSPLPQISAYARVYVSGNIDLTPGLIQCLRGWRSAACPVTGGRVGGFLLSKLRLTWLYGDQNDRVCIRGNAQEIQWLEQTPAGRMSPSYELKGVRILPPSPYF